VSGELLREFDLIPGTEDCHRDALQGDYLDISDRVCLLIDMVGEDGGIGDPVWGTVEPYQSPLLSKR